jgi:hypothetical protein
MVTFRPLLAALTMCAIATALLVSVAPARAQTVALSFSNDGGFTNGFTGTLGWEFTVNSTENLIDFGFYNNGGTIATSHQVGLWDASGDLLTSGTVGPSAADTTIGYFDYSPTTPYTLQAGDTYIIGTLLSSSDFFYYDPSTITTDPSISYVQTQFDVNDTPSLTFPQTTDFPSNGYGYFGPSFEVPTIQGPTGVPEPGAFLVLPLGLAILAGVRLRVRLRGASD